jgi:phosphoribosylanthranilate isomerase
MNCRTKICGITNLEDALAACEFGADALGFVFYEKSPRYIDPIKANEIVKQLPPFVVPIALFVNASETSICAVIEGNSRWVIQFHGDESNPECAQFKRTFIKALRVKPDDDINHEITKFPDANAILLDAYKAGVPGGTGESFNWDLVPKKACKPIILAGGLTVSNVRQAVEQVKPYAVDVSGGVELTKGIKDHLKVQQFITGAKCG